MAEEIQILSSEKINKEKWNQCIAQAANGLIYSNTHYLDLMCDHWSGLVAGDYTTIMALPWRKKYGIRYIYQPPFIQQLGLIGNNTLHFDNVFRFAKYGDILLNDENTKLADALNAVQRTNFVIDLSQGYDVIISGYKKDLLLNLKKAEKEALLCVADTNIESAVKMYQLLYQQRMDDISDNDFSRFISLARYLADNDMCFIRKVTDDKGTVLAVGLFLKDDKRIYNIMNTTTEDGRIKEANHFLLDAVIREFAGQDLLFDFEGSDLRGVKMFYEKFSPVMRPYYYYHYNKLPALLKLIKK